jgi:hypothetical protein
MDTLAQQPKSHDFGYNRYIFTTRDRAEFSRMNSFPRRGRRWLATGAVVVAALLLSGCVYLRLLILKHQLADFDRNFALETAQGVRLRCLKPVLLTGDLRWLGIVPEVVTKQGRAELWRVKWVKEDATPAGAVEPAALDLELEINFADKKLTGFFIAERYFAFIPKPFLIELLRGLGGATIDKSERSVSANIALSDAKQPNARPTAASLAALLGGPSERRHEGSHVLLRYRYLATPPGSNGGDFDLLFTFDQASGLLLRLHGHSPVGNILLNFEPAAPASKNL